MSTTVLCFDDWPFERRDNLERRIGNPEICQNGIFIDPILDTTFSYPSVIRDNESGMWRCIYTGTFKDETRINIPATAISDNGITWHADTTRSSHTDGRWRVGHQLMDVEQYVDANRPWGGVGFGMCYEDLKAVDERYRYQVTAVVPFKPSLSGPAPINRSVMASSADGVHWVLDLERHWHPYGAEPHTVPFFNAARSCYGIATRPSWGDRRIALVETRNWATFSDATLILEADPLDSPCAQLYGMPIFAYENIYIGLLWVYHTPPTVDGPGKGRGGTIDCQLTYSRNGTYFKRLMRDPFISRSEPGEYGTGMALPCSMISDGNHMLIYGFASRMEHAIAPNDDRPNSAIITYALRPDGFCFFATRGGVGFLITQRMIWNGEQLQINAAVPDGELRIQITDEEGKPIAGFEMSQCIPLRNDMISWQPEWESGRKLVELVGQVVRLEVAISNGRFYALRGEFEWPPPLVLEPTSAGEPLSLNLTPFDGLEALE